MKNFIQPPIFGGIFIYLIEAKKLYNEINIKM